MTPKQMREKRLTLANQARAMLEKANGENRSLTAEEKTQYDKVWAEMQDLKADIERAENLEAVERELGESRGRQAGGERSDGANAGGAGGSPRVIALRNSVTGEARTVVMAGPSATQQYADGFRRFLAGGIPALDGSLRDALQMDSDTGGGYLLAPQQFQAELIMGLDDEVFMRRISRILPPITNAESLGAPSLDNDLSDTEWTTELSVGTEDTTMSFGKRELRPHPNRKRIKVSKTLLRRSPMPVEAIIRERMVYKFGTGMEYNYLLGDGTQKPLGIFVASANGIPTTRDVSSGNTATEIRGDGLVNAKYSLKAQYRRNAQWVFHRDAVKQISLLKDGEGRYMWIPSVRDGEPDRILNLPYNESEYAPNTFTTGKYVGILGDFRYYWIVDALSLSIQVLDQLYAETNQNGYIGQIESDGMPVLDEAFARVKLG